MGPVESRAQTLGRSRGFTLLELVVVVCIVAFLFGVALDRLMRYREMAERAVVQQNLGALNTALTLKFAALVAIGRGDAIEKEVSRNPVDLLARPPQDYLGELYAPTVDTLPRPSWYYDRSTGHLVYLPGRARFLTSPAGATDGLHFHVVLTSPSPRRDEIVLRELRQAIVQPVHPYRWELD